MRQKGFGDILPVRGQVYEVTTRIKNDRGYKLDEADMTCFFAVTAYPLSDKFVNKGKFAPRAWLMDEKNNYWGWGSKSYAWPMRVDAWQHELRMAGFFGEGMSPVLDGIRADTPPRISRNMKRGAIEQFLARTKIEVERMEERLRELDEWDRKEGTRTAAEIAEIEDLR